MSTTEVLISDKKVALDNTQSHDKFPLPRMDSKRVVINQAELKAQRVSGAVIHTNVKQHTHVYTTHKNTANSVLSSVGSHQWETSELRLRFEDGTERVYELPFAVSAGEGDLFSVISLFKENGDGYTVAAQNHTIGRVFTQDKSGLTTTCAKLNVFKITSYITNKNSLIAGAILAILLYVIFESLIGAAIGAFFGLGFLILGIQYLVVLPYVLAVWPETNRQLQSVFDDFSRW